MEHMYVLCASEEDTETKHLYFCIFKVSLFLCSNYWIFHYQRIRKALMNRTKPTFDDPPPFERPSIDTVGFDVNCSYFLYRQ